MNFKLEQEFSKTDIIHQVDELKKQIDAMRPLPADVEGKVMQKLRLDWNYHSNAIEGNRLNYGETVAFLMEGITAKGKPLKDHLDIRGHNEAINFLMDIVKDSRPISEADIRNLHTMILVEPYQVKAQTAEGSPTSKRITLGEYKTSPNHVQTATGETHYYATPEETPAKMQELMEWYNAIVAQKDVHPLVIAALFHHKFVAIHPFDDGNGRLSRILMNLVLMQNGYPPVVIKTEDRQNYYALLTRADNNDSWPFVEYIAESMFSSLNLYLKAAMGDDIDEDDDIDKELALFTMGVQSKVIQDERVKPIEIHNIVINDLLPIVSRIVQKMKVFEKLFHKSGTFSEIDYRVLNDNTIHPHSTFIKNGHDLKSTISSYPGYRIEYITYNFSFGEFKNPDNVFSITSPLSFTFNEYDYIIDNQGLGLEILKPYRQKLTKDESKKIITTVLKHLKELIKENLD